MARSYKEKKRTISDVKRLYFIQFHDPKRKEWVFTGMNRIKNGFEDPKKARDAIEKVMTHHNHFVKQDYRLVERTIFTVDEPFERFNRG